MSEEQFEINSETTITGVWEKLEKSMREGGIVDPAEQDSFRNAWYAGAFDTVHVVLNLVRSKDPHGLTTIHDEVHAYMSKVMADLAAEESEHASKQ